MNVDFGPDQQQALERLSTRFGHTKAQIIRAGLALIQIATRETERGRAIGVVNDGRVVTELTGMWSEAVKEGIPA